MENNISSQDMKKLEYYLNLGDDGKANNPEQFIKRARDLGFVGLRPLKKGDTNKKIKNKPRQEYIDFLNKKFKDVNTFENNPVLRTVNKYNINPRYTTHIENGGEYLKRYNNYLITKEPFTIDLKNKQKLVVLLNKIELDNNKLLIKFVFQSGGISYTTLTRTSINAIKRGIFEDNWDKEEFNSDSLFELQKFLALDTIKNITFSEAPPDKLNGTFFKYTHNLKDMNFVDLQVYKDLDEMPSNTVCCFIQSLISANIDENIIQKCKLLISSRAVAMCKIDKICEELGLHITVKRLRTEVDKDKTQVIHYPIDKKSPLRILPAINIGLIDTHYFHIKKVNITSYAVDNYDEIKHLENYQNIVQKINNTDISKIKYVRRKTEYIDSFSLILKLLNNKKNLLTKIPLSDKLYSTQYYDMVDDEIIDLSYNESNYRPVEYNAKIDEMEYINVFSDFESTTDGEKHNAYLCNISNDKKNFIGKNCGKQMLNYLVKKFKGNNIRLIFHNAGYDFKFLFEYLHSVKLIERGKSLLRGTARYYYGENNYINICVQCSYALIPEKLSKFKDMFAIDMKKEILPYGLYTENNVKKMDIDIATCLYEVKEQYKNNNIGKFINKKDKKITKDFDKENKKLKEEYKKGEDEFVKEYFDNVEEWNCYNEDRTEINIIKYSSKYCKADVDVLEAGYNSFRKSIRIMSLLADEDKEPILDGESVEDEDEDGEFLDINNYCSIASVSYEYMKMKGVFNNVMELSGIPREFINKCMYGGRTMMSNNIKDKVETERFNKDFKDEIDKIEEKFKGWGLADFDAVSLYPSAQFRLGGYLQGLPKIITNLSYDDLKTKDGYFIEILIKSVGKKYDFPTMSKKTKEGIRDWTNDMEGETMFVDKTTMEDIIKYHKIEYQIIKGYYFDEGRNMLLKPVMENVFNLRLKAKADKNPIQAVYKLIMNSAYGKTLLKPFSTEIEYISEKKIKEYIGRNYNWIIEATILPNGKTYKVKTHKSINKHFNIVQAGVEVLSMSKRIMNEVMFLAEDNDIKMYYQDTDSIHMDNDKIDELTKLYAKKYPDNPPLIGKGMGQFHSDFSSDIFKGDIIAIKSIFLAKKCYCDVLISDNNVDVIDYHIRLKGVPNASILDYSEEHNITPYEVYEKLYYGEEIEFDLTCRGKKPVFEYENAMTVKSKRKFTRKICFKKKKKKDEEDN